MVPLIFLNLWIAIAIFAYSKDGEYDAPPGMLYMQSKAENMEKQRQFLEQ